jgi:cytochrome c oxidase subunit 2
MHVKNGAKVLRLVLTGLAVLIVGLASPCFADFPTPWQMGFQTPASPMMERIVTLHDQLFIVIIAIAVVVTAILGYTVFRFSAKRNKTLSTTTHHTWLEVIWTAIPAIIVVGLAIPSVKLIYFIDQEPQNAMNIKVIGHQWYWSYEYPDQSIAFDSYMVEDKDIQAGQIRLLSVDNNLVVPVGVPVCLQLTSMDVLHSWAVPALGVKKDTVPGRLNQMWLQVDRPGLYYGQCSELCGMKHGFMPIVVEAVTPEQYALWLEAAKTKFAFRQTGIRHAQVTSSSLIQIR